MGTANSEWLTVQAAAKLAGYDPEHIRRLIREGHIKAVKFSPAQPNNPLRTPFWANYIAIGGICSATDALEFLVTGAAAVQVGTQNFIDPSASVQIAEGIARFCDVFCETGVFSVGQTERIFRAAQAVGLELRVHADELTDLGGAAMAARMKARTADHLLYANDDGIRAMAEAGVIAVLLPGTAYFLHMQRYARARDMIAGGVPVALATDFNPGSCMTESLPLIMNLACTQMRMLPAEAITAATINAAQDLALTVPPPTDVRLAVTGGEVALSFSMRTNVLYDVQHIGNSSPGGWSDVVTNLAGTVDVTDTPAPGLFGRLYRARLSY